MAQDLNQCNFISLYVDHLMTVREVAAIKGVAISSMRRMLKGAGVLRTPKDAQVLSGRNGRKGAHNIGKKRVVTEATKLKMSEGRKRWAERCARGTSVKPSGYAEVTMGENKFKGLHRVVVEKHIGRRLEPTEVVHHIDGNKLNNSIENLQIMNAKDHCSLHAKQANRKRDEHGRII